MESNPQDKLLAAALRKLESIKRQEAFDPEHLNSIPTKKQQQVIDDFGKFKQYWIRAGNQSGKSQTCARILTWVLTNTYPGWQRPSEWGDEPLLAIVAGRTGKQLEESLLPKIRSYLEPGTYKEVRVGNSIQRLELANGSRIVFQSLENPNIARERLMSYVAHITWVDELPPTPDLVREVLVRTQARNGYSLFSFTPTVVNIEIQRMVDSLQEPEGKVYRFHMLDNPLYQDEKRRLELLTRYSHHPEHIQKAIFEGEWLSSDDQVYYFNYETMVGMPEGYSPLWRHVLSVDPAISSALGMTIWAEVPDSGIWYCVKAEYIKGIYVPTDIVKTVEKFCEKINVVRRTSDYAPWYTNTASSMGYTYHTVESKNANRKSELIKNLQEKLGHTIKICPTETDLITEFQECRWSDKGEGKMINSSSYHLLDSAQYFCDIIPRPEKKLKSFTVPDWYRQLLEANEKRKALEQKAIEKIEAKYQRRSKPTRIRRGGAMWK